MRRESFEDRFSRGDCLHTIDPRVATGTTMVDGFSKEGLLLESSQPPMPGRIIGFVFAFVFLGVGVSVLVFLWSQPFGGFGSPPLLFRLIGSLISLAFIAMGGTGCYAAVTGRGVTSRFRRGVFPMGGPRGAAPGHPTGRRYECPQCGAPLSEGADVSPSGDVRCAHCNAWFNVHGSGA